MDKDTREQVMAGYQRIAFGDIRDPVRLLFCDELSSRALKTMDLFSISEIRRPKGGGMEIKFFDRIRALQCMQEMNGESEGSCGFYDALERGADSLWGAGEAGEQERGEQEENRAWS